MKPLIFLLLSLVLECLAAPQLITLDIKETSNAPTENFPNVIHLKEEWTHVSFLKAKPDPSTTTTEQNLVESTTPAQAPSNDQKVIAKNETPDQQKDENIIEKQNKQSLLTFKGPLDELKNLPSSTTSVVTEYPITTTVKPFEEVATKASAAPSVRSKRSIYNYDANNFDNQDLEAQSDLQDSRDKRDASSYDIHDLSGAPQLWSILRPFIEPRFSKYKRDLEQLERAQHAVHHNYDALKTLLKHDDPQTNLSAEDNQEHEHSDHTDKTSDFANYNENDSAKSFNKVDEETDNNNKNMENLDKAKPDEMMIKSSDLMQKKNAKIEVAKELETNNEKPQTGTLARPKPPSVAELFARAQQKASAEKQ